MATAYPLYWPANRPRTVHRHASKFKVGKMSFARVRDELLNELKLMRAAKVILSSNIPLRHDGLPLAGQPRVRDPGVAVYFHYKQREAVSAGRDCPSQAFLLALFVQGVTATTSN